MAHKSSRRSFLAGKVTADAMSATAQSPLWPAGSYLVRVSREAMACEFEVILNAGQYPQGTEAALEALELVVRLEDQMSVFRPESEIARLNRTAAKEPVEIEPELFALLESALRLSAETEGAFDVTAGALVDAWGFSQRRGTVPTEEQLREALDKKGSDLVELNAEQSKVRFRKPGVKLNLGAIGKGYAVDRAAARLLEAGINDFLVHGGQSSVVARGATREISSGSAVGEAAGWSIGLGHPLRAGERLAEISLRNRALGTSGSAKQFFEYQGRRWSHIVDPRTGWPAEGILSASVAAPTAALADGLSTALFVMGPERALAYCQERPELAALLVCPAAEGGGVELLSAGLLMFSRVMQ